MALFFDTQIWLLSSLSVKNYEDTEEHAVHCEKLKMHMTPELRQLLENSSYSDLFSDVTDQLRITEAFQIIIKTRERLQDTSGPLCEATWALCRQ